MSLLRIDGMIDPHVHLRGMDWSHKATFASETKAALAGGYWAVLDMPNTEPATISRDALQYKRTQISAQAVCDWGLYYGADASDNSQTFAVIQSGVCGLKIYNNATTGNLLIDNQATREAMYANWQSSKPIAVHAEDETVPKILELIRKYHIHTHFVHISTKLEIDYLRAAKEEGLPISIGVTPHHLFLTQDDLSQLGPFGRMKPGLKTTADRDALWQAISNNLVDVIESDHAPHTRAEKESENPPYGVPGLETTLPLMLQAVRDRRLTLDQLIPMLSSNIHRIFGLNVPVNTYTVVDTSPSFVIDATNLQGNCDWTPFDGMPASGVIREVYIRGTKVFDNGSILVDEGFGQAV